LRVVEAGDYNSEKDEEVRYRVHRRVSCQGGGERIRTMVLIYQRLEGRAREGKNDG
jgi:hypothetical protein